MLHRLLDLLQRGALPASSSTATKMLTLPGTAGALVSYGTTKPTDTTAGYSPGHIFIKTDGTTNTILYINTGTSTSCTFKRIDEVSAIAGMTVPTSQTLAVTDADKLTVGGLIVPQVLELDFHIPKIAADTIYNIFVAPRAYTVTGIKYVPTILQGGALTITPVKATGTTAPAAATTPLVSAGFDGNTGLHTVQTGSLTATGADLALAAGDRIGVVLSTASTVHQGHITISMKRS